MWSFQKGGRPGAHIMDRGNNTILKRLLWVRKVLGSLFKGTYVLAGKILKSCRGVGDSYFCGSVIGFVRRNIIYEEHLMAFFMDNHFFNSCRGRKVARHIVWILALPVRGTTWNSVLCKLAVPPDLCPWMTGLFPRSSLLNFTSICPLSGILCFPDSWVPPTSHTPIPAALSLDP